jgi:two-component sensor histidine kinase
VNRQRIAEFIQLIRPWSLAAFAFAFAALATATAVRAIFAHFGATLYFATYFPIVLIVSVFAGIPAGAATAVCSLIIVWWAFIPPHFAFNELKVSDYANFALYGLSTTLVIGLSHLYRTTLMALLQTQRGRELLVNELNHRAGNLLTVIQSIVKGTLAGDQRDARRLSGRIEALARADDLVSCTADGIAFLYVCLEAEKISQLTMKRAAISGPMTKPFRPNTSMRL